MITLTVTLFNQLQRKGHFMETDESCYVTPISNIGKLASQSQKVTIADNLQRENRLLKIEIAALKSQMGDADKVITIPL